MLLIVSEVLVLLQDTETNPPIAGPWPPLQSSNWSRSKQVKLVKQGVCPGRKSAAARSFNGGGVDQHGQSVWTIRCRVDVADQRRGRDEAIAKLAILHRASRSAQSIKQSGGCDFGCRVQRADDLDLTIHQWVGRQEKAPGRSIGVVWGETKLDNSMAAQIRR